MGVQSHFLPSRDECLQTLRHSGLSSIIVEGREDYNAYRRLQENFFEDGVSVFDVGGRENVLWLFERRHLFSQIRSLFIVDSDMWLYQGVPPVYAQPSLLRTNGYSIENDLLEDGNFERLFSQQERRDFKRDLSSLVLWFSHIVQLHCAGNSPAYGYHIDQILDRDGNVTLKVAAESNFNHQNVLHAMLAARPIAMLRGKTLISLYLRYLSYTGRSARHTGAGLLEMAAVMEGPNFCRLRTEIEAQFQAI